jgi:protein-tyrosine phosphatase
MAERIYGIAHVNEIIPNLYLTSYYGATRENVIKKGVTLVVNSAQELPKQNFPGVEYIKLILEDVPSAIIHIHFDRIADKIDEHLKRGGRVMVHCVCGISRSTTLVIGYLIKYKGMTLNDALDLCSSKRPIVRPNSGEFLFVSSLCFS